MHAQVVVGAVCHTHELAPFAALETKTVLNVNGARRVVRAVVLRNIELAHVLGVNAQVNKPVPAVFNPCVEVLICFVGVNEVFDFHLLEFAGAEDEVAGGDLVTERFTNLPDTEGRAFTGRSYHVVEVHEDALRGFRAQKVQPFLVIDRTQVGFQQAREVLRFGPFAAGAAVRADNLTHIFGCTPLFSFESLNQVVLALAPVAREAFHQRVHKGCHVPGCFPHRARQDYRRVQPDHICA